MMVSYIDAYKDRFGVELICRVLASNLSGGFMTSRGYRAAKARPQSARSLRDVVLVEQVKRIHEQNYGVYGVRKMWHAMNRAGWDVGRDQTARLMALAQVRGIRRGRPPVTTRRARVLDTRPDLVHRDFTATRPDQLWVADMTYVRTISGFVYTAFVADVFSRKIVGWATRSTMKTEDLPMEALDQAITLAKDSLEGLIHHCDHGSQYVSIAYSNALADHKIRSSTGSVGDSYDNALAETINGLYKTELIYSQRWESLAQVEFATMNWVHWWNTTRLHESLNYQTPQEVITNYNHTHARQLAPT